MQAAGLLHEGLPPLSRVLFEREADLRKPDRPDRPE